MSTTTALENGSAISAAELRGLQQRSDAKGLLRLLLHLTAIGGSAWLYNASLQLEAQRWLSLPCAVVYGFTLASMFAAMHESVHRTAFKTRALNDAVGWFAGLLSFYNSTFYRYYHGWHHRFTQQEGGDPELEDAKPKDLAQYALELSGLTWWLGKLRGHISIALGRVDSYGFLNDETRPAVVRSVRWQLLVYAAAGVASLLLERPWFFSHFLLPLAAGQPVLRAILLAEHMGCGNSQEALSNTRTTYTILPIRLLMWEMPYHAEHHRYPALPFFALAAAHQRLEPQLAHVARRGYSGFHLELLRKLRNRSTPQASP